MSDDHKGPCKDYCAVVDECQARGVEIVKLRADLAAEREECLEQARLNGMGAERELKLIAARDAAEAHASELIVLLQMSHVAISDAREFVATFLAKRGEGHLIGELVCDWDYALEKIGTVLKGDT